MASKVDLRNAIHFDDDFIALSKFKCSIKKMIEKCPDGVTDEVAAQALYVTVDEFQDIYKSAFEKLRTSFGS